MLDADAMLAIVWDRLVNGPLALKSGPIFPGSTHERGEPVCNAYTSSMQHRSPHDRYLRTRASEGLDRELLTAVSRLQ
jgi:hypothetical protein